MVYLILFLLGLLLVWFWFYFSLLHSFKFLNVFCLSLFLFFLLAVVHFFLWHWFIVSKEWMMMTLSICK